MKNKKSEKLFFSLFVLFIISSMLEIVFFTLTVLNDWNPFYKDIWRMVNQLGFYIFLFYFIFFITKEK